MKCGFATWETLDPVQGSVLLIVNTPPGLDAEVESLVGALRGAVVHDDLHVVAPPSWREWLRRRGFEDDRLLESADADGREVEMNYFLETSAFRLWTAEKTFRVVVGSSAHNLYNEEVQLPFERQVSLFLRGGHLLAHALPHDYIYVFDTPHLVRRLGRPHRVAEYRATCRALLDDLHGVWVAHGAPVEGATAEFDDVLEPVRRHLGEAVLTFDESSPIPMSAECAGDAELTALLAHASDLLDQRDRQLKALNDALVRHQRWLWIPRAVAWWRRVLGLAD